MTPQEANALLARVKDSDPSALAELMDWKDVAEALETIANMGHVYDYEVAFGDEWTPQGYEFASFKDVRHAVVSRRRKSPARIVRRLVSAPVVVV